MVKNLSKVTLFKYISQRGTGQAIHRDEAIVYDFMPVILGDQFRIDDILSKMLLRRAPVDAPFMLAADAYEKLGLRYVTHDELVPALECYRIALDSRTSFTAAIASMGRSALLNPNEIKHLDLSTDLERKLVENVAKSGRTYDQQAYSSWLEGLKAARKQWLGLNKTAYGSKAYVEACLPVGEYQEALLNAQELGDKTLVRSVQRARPHEILDVKFLGKYIDDNFPESSMGREPLQGNILDN